MEIKDDKIKGGKRNVKAKLREERFRADRLEACLNEAIRWNEEQLMPHVQDLKTQIENLKTEMLNLRTENKNQLPTEDEFITCFLCQKLTLVEGAHLHQGHYIGDCCWDENLKETE